MRKAGTAFIAAVVSLATILVAVPGAAAAPTTQNRSAGPSAAQPTPVGVAEGSVTPDATIDLTSALLPTVEPPIRTPSADVANLRERFVLIDVGAVRSLLAAAEEASAPVRLAAFDDAVAEVVPQRFELRDDGYAFSGWASHGSEDQVMVISASDPSTLPALDDDPLARPSTQRPVGAGLSAELWLGSRQFRIEPVAGAVHVLSEVDTSAEAAGDEGTASPPAATGDGSGSAADLTDPAVLGGDVEPASHTQEYSGTVDVLAVFTPAARSYRGAGLESWIAGQMEAANTANARSGIPWRFRLVRVEAISYTEQPSNAAGDLLRLKQTASEDAYLNEAHTSRDRYGADAVVLVGRGWSSTNQPYLTPPAPVCGIGYQMGASNYGASFGSWAFSVVDAACDLTLAHEVGHNLALRHDWANSDGNDSPFPYNHGHVSIPGDFRTIMAYDSALCPGGSCTRIVNWSDPDNTYNGWPTGTAEGGINAADNARALLHTGGVVGAFRYLPTPFGALDSVSLGPNGGRVSGWAIDPDVTGSIDVHAYVDGAGAAVLAANQERPDVGLSYPGYGPYHGYLGMAPASGGTHTFCTYGINVLPGGVVDPSGNALLGCKSYTVPVNPVGYIDSITRAPGGARVSGWTLDPDTANPIDVHVWVDGVGAAVGTANQTRTDIGAAYPGFGNQHGFSLLVPMSSGVSHQVCAYGINVDEGGNALLECETFVTHPHPIGVLDTVRRAPGGIRAVGWAIDPDTASPINVHVYVDGVFRASGSANSYRADVAAANPDYGGNHGYEIYVGGVAAGTHEVCTYGINVGVGSNALLTCKNVTVTVDPVGTWVTAVRTGAVIQVTGWALDPDTADPIEVRVTNGLGLTTTATADRTRGDMGSWAQYYGSNHGFDVTIAASVPSDTICVTMLNVGAGSNVSLGCRTL